MRLTQLENVNPRSMMLLADAQPDEVMLKDPLDGFFRARKATSWPSQFCRFITGNHNPTLLC